MEILDRELTAIERGENDRLIVQMPPRHGKSMLSSIYFPAHYLGRFPDRNVMLTGATDDLSSDFSAAARDIIDEHGWMFGVSLKRHRASKERWELEQGGGLRSGGVGSGKIMGRGANLLIIDDYFKNVEDALSETMRRKLYQWYLSTSGTRLMPGGAIVIIATRWHPKDLIGEVLKTAEQTGEKWRVVSFPALGDDGAALWPEQWPAEAMERKRAEFNASGYPWKWEALYQQNPPEILDAEWPSHYFDDIWFEDWPGESIITVVALDPSLGKTDKADYAAFVALKKGHDGVYYCDAKIERLDSRRIVYEGIEWMKHIRPHHFGCEDVAFQELLCEQFEPKLEEAKLHARNVWRIKSALPKLTRIRSLTSLLATGRIKVRKSPGGALLVEQLKGFPSHKFDDGPDALEMSIRLCEELLGGTGLEDREEILTT